MKTQTGICSRFNGTRNHSTNDAGNTFGPSSTLGQTSPSPGVASMRSTTASSRMWARPSAVPPVTRRRCPAASHRSTPMARRPSSGLQPPPAPPAMWPVPWRCGATSSWPAMRRWFATGGTSTHHHAVGRDHRSAYEVEVPALMRSALAGAKQALDPQGVMNPGVLNDPMGRSVGFAGATARCRWRCSGRWG